MKRTTMGFGKIGMNLGALKLADKKVEDPPNDDKGGGESENGGFGKISASPAASKSTGNVPEDNAQISEDEMAKVMGFSGFSSGKPNKKAQQFDVEAMFASASKSAQEQNMLSNQKLEDEGRQSLDTEFIIPINPQKPKVKSSKQTDIDTSKKDSSEVLDKTKKDSSKDSGGDESSDEESSDDDMIGPLPPGSSSVPVAGDDLEEDSEEEEVEETLVDKIPRSHEIKLVHGDKAITALSLDPSGARVVSGGVDYDLKLWDFAGMDPSLRSFRKIRPCESHVLNHIDYSSTGDKILVVSGDAQPKVLDRDGGELFQHVKGDQYVLDQARNKGHTATGASGAWHPKIKSEYMTCAADATIRLWDVEAKGRKTRQVIKCKSRKNGLRTNPTSCTYSRDGLLVCGVHIDGSIKMWDHRKNFVNVALNMENAHTNGSEITSVMFGYDNRLLATRSNDETLKLWDVRQFKRYVNCATGLFSRFSQTECCFSPDDRMILTGTSMEKGDKAGKLVFFNKDSFEKVFEMEVGESHVIRAAWHPKLNQIMVGSGDGIVRVYYDPERSVRGAKLCMVKKRTEAKQVNYIATQKIITPYALPLFKEGQERQKSTYRQLMKDRKDPLKSRNPDPPQLIKGTGGKTAQGGSTLHSWMAKQIAVKNKDDHIDPRERILRHAKDAEENPYWVDNAYAKTQPKKIFRDINEEEPPRKMTKKETFG